MTVAKAKTRINSTRKFSPVKLMITRNNPVIVMPIHFFRVMRVAINKMARVPIVFIKAKDRRLMRPKKAGTVPSWSSTPLHW